MAIDSDCRPDQECGLPRLLLHVTYFFFLKLNIPTGYKKDNFLFYYLFIYCMTNSVIAFLTLIEIGDLLP